MITITSKGSFQNIENFLGRVSSGAIFKSLEGYAQQGVDALRSATPIATGLTAESWYYKVRQDKGFYSIEWLNSNVVDGRPIAILLQYGHGTRNGGYVKGKDYINPAIKPIFDKIADEVWKAVTSA